MRRNIRLVRQDGKPVRRAYKGGESSAFISVRGGKELWETRYHTRVHPELKERAMCALAEYGVSQTSLIRGLQKISHLLKTEGMAADEEGRKIDRALVRVLDAFMID